MKKLHLNKTTVRRLSRGSLRTVRGGEEVETDPWPCGPDPNDPDCVTKTPREGGDCRETDQCPTVWGGATCYPWCQ